MRRLRRRYAGVKHGPDCDCNVCLEHNDSLDREFELVSVPGITVDMDDGTPAVDPEHRHRFHPDATYVDGGPLIHDWILPHHGDGASDCGELLERVGGVHPTTNHLSWWGRIKKCGQRECQRCGPVIEAGKIVTPGTWEMRSARRAAENILGHQEDRRLGITKRRTGGQKIVAVTDRAVKMQRSGYHKPPRIAHVVWSPAPSRWDELPADQKTKNRLDNLYREAYRDLKAVGVTGGYAVTHGLRIPSRWNDRTHAVPGLHLHCLVLTNDYTTGRIDGHEVKRIHGRRGTVIKRVTNHHKGGDIDALNDKTAEGPEPNRSVFGSLLYLLSHATWPTLAIMREPGEEWTVRDARVVFLRHYPAFVKTSTQTKAIRPFGEWVHEPESVVVLPSEEDTCPITGHAFAEDDVWPVLFAKPPPEDEEAGIVLRGHYRRNEELRVFEVGEVRAKPPAGEQARIWARMQGRPAPEEERPMQRDPEAEARRRGQQLAAEMKRRDEEGRAWEL